MGLVIVTAPTVEPVTLEEAKLHLRVDNTADDALILALIESARTMVEAITQRALITQTWDYKIDDWPDTDYIRMPLPPLQSITSITYKLYTDGSTSTFASASYFAVTSMIPGRAALKPGYTWPSESLYPYQAIAVQFVCGYGAGGSYVPEPLKSALKLLIGHLYENREAVREKNVQALPWGVTHLLAPYRVYEEY